MPAVTLCNIQGYMDEEEEEEEVSLFKHTVAANYPQGQQQLYATTQIVQEKKQIFEPALWTRNSKYSVRNDKQFKYFVFLPLDKNGPFGDKTVPDS